MLNLSLSASNRCLMLRFRAWAVYHCCSFWKLGSCVSPMMSTGACCTPLCSTCLAECDQAGQRKSFLKGVPCRLSLAPPTLYSEFVRVTPPHRPAGLHCMVVVQRHQYSNTQYLDQYAAQIIRQYRQYLLDFSSFYCCFHCKFF